jgi:hypothetical protein
MKAMNRQITLKAMNITETFIGLTAAPRTLAMLADASKGTYRVAARRALKHLRQSQARATFSRDNQYVHSCWAI